MDIAVKPQLQQAARILAEQLKAFLDSYRLRLPVAYDGGAESSHKLHAEYYAQQYYDLLASYNVPGIIERLAGDDQHAITVQDFTDLKNYMSRLKCEEPVQVSDFLKNYSTDLHEIEYAIRCQNARERQLLGMRPSNGMDHNCWRNRLLGCDDTHKLEAGAGI